MAPAVAERDPLRAAFAKYADNGFTSRDYSDLTVVLPGGKELYVHRLVVCEQSEFFAKALDPNLGFKEAQLGTIVLDDNPPEVVEAMLEYMYTRDYRFPAAPDSFPDGQDFIFHVNCYAIGHEYDLKSLKDLAKYKFNDLQSREKYSFLRHAGEIVSAVYTSTPHTDRGLRDIALRLCKSNAAHLMQTWAFYSTMESVEGFFRELSQLLAGVENTSEPKRYMCEACGYTRTYSEDELCKAVVEEKVACDDCDKVFDLAHWRLFEVSDEGSEYDDFLRSGGINPDKMVLKKL